MPSDIKAQTPSGAACLTRPSLTGCHVAKHFLLLKRWALCQGGATVNFGEGRILKHVVKGIRQEKTERQA